MSENDKNLSGNFDQFSPKTRSKRVFASKNFSSTRK